MLRGIVELSTTTHGCESTKAFALVDAETAPAIVDLPDRAVEPEFVRIRVVAASVNGFDVFEANRYLVAVMEHRFPTVIGRDFAGVVDAVGDGRTDVSVGDEVFGFVTSQPPLDVGTYAEWRAKDLAWSSPDKPGRRLVRRGRGDPSRRGDGARSR